MKTIFKTIFLLIILILTSCGGYRILNSNHNLILYNRDTNYFFIIGEKSIISDSTWKSKFCDEDHTNLVFLTYGDSISVLSKHKIKLDSVFSKEIDGVSYTVFRKNVCVFDGETCNCTYYTHKKEEYIYYGPYKYIDFYTLSGIIKKIKFFFLAT